MDFIKWIIRWLQQYGSTIFTGIAAAFLLSMIIGKWWPDARGYIFFGLSALWLSGGALVAFRDRETVYTKRFEDPRKWNPAELPGEYRAIEHGITRSELISVLGAYKSVPGSDIGRYDLPSGGAIFVYIQSPITDSSVITGVQYYPSYGEVPVFPL